MLLALIVLVQFGYPITVYGTAALVLYEILYASMIAVGVIVGRDSKSHMLFLAGAGIVFFSASLIYAFNPGATWAIFITYLALIPYQLMLLWILGRFLIIAKTITRDVLYAAVALYLLLGAVFVPIFGLLDLLIPGPFRDKEVSQKFQCSGNNSFILATPA